MDCKTFRNHHLAYLDDTLSGEQTSAAQRHVLACDGCAAHDTLVRRSLMMARSLQPIEPSAAFQERLRARLAECRDESVANAAANAAATAALLNAPTRSAMRSPRMFAAVAAGAVLGTLAWRGMAMSAPPAIVMQPVIASQPAMPNSYITPALMQAMSTGNPVWPAAVLIEDVPTHFVAADFTFADDMR